MNRRSLYAWLRHPPLWVLLIPALLICWAIVIGIGIVLIVFVAVSA